MPNIDQDAKAWELDLGGRVGKAVLARRKALKMTAVQLAERTKELGYPISRVTVTKIENNTRAGKLDVAELLILARALDMPPALLLSPDYPDGKVELLPDFDADGRDIVRWFSGAALFPPEIAEYGTVRTRRSNPGVDLVRSVENREQCDFELFRLQGMARDDSAPAEAHESVMRLIKDREEKLAALIAEIGQHRAALWGSPEEESNG